MVSAVGVACGGDDGDSTTGSSSTTSTTVVFSGENSTEFCARYTEFTTTYTTTSLDPATVPVDELATKWAAVVVALGGMEAAASTEIRPDVKELRATVEELQPALAAVGYDPTKVPEAERERFQSPAAETAAARLSAYGAQVCDPESG
ncbi:MAG: hypothetical protein ACXW2C_05895 [Acidimicrobiia bacterium]